MTKYNQPAQRYNRLSPGRIIILGAFAISLAAGLVSSAVQRHGGQSSRTPDHASAAMSWTSRQLDSMLTAQGYVKGGAEVAPSDPAFVIRIAETASPAGGARVFVSADGGTDWREVAYPPEAPPGYLPVMVDFAPVTGANGGQANQVFALTYASPQAGITPGADTVVVEMGEIAPSGDAELLGGAAGNMDLSGATGSWVHDPDGWYYTVNTAAGGGDEVQDLGVGEYSQ